MTPAAVAGPGALAVLVLVGLAGRAWGQAVLEGEVGRRLEIAAGRVREGRYSEAMRRLDSVRELLAAAGVRGDAVDALDRRAAALREQAAGRFAETGDAVTGEPAESPRARIERLIGELGNPTWAVRERATRELAEAGEEAIGPLERALDDADPEVRHRAGGILSGLRARESGRPFRFQLGVVLWTAGEAVLVDAGSQDGLAAGAKGVAFRPGEFGARLEVVEVRLDWARVRVVEAIGGGTVAPGDLAEFSAEFER